MTGIHPYATQVDDWWQHEERQHAAQVAVQPGEADQATLARVLAALRRGDEPPLFPAARDAVTGPRPVIQPTPEPQDRGQIRALLARMAEATARLAEPVFRHDCEACSRTRGGWCTRHAAMRDEHAAFTRLAAQIITAASDRDAMLLVAGFADGDDHRIPADSGWPDQQKHARNLLTEAEGNALPDNIGCCTDGNPCHDHAEAIEVSEFVGAIRDAVIDAGSAHEAGQLIMLAITAGGK
jgi:hypothetical protein